MLGVRAQTEPEPARLEEHALLGGARVPQLHVDARFAWQSTKAVLDDFRRVRRAARFREPCFEMLPAPERGDVLGRLARGPCALEANGRQALHFVVEARVSRHGERGKAQEGRDAAGGRDVRVFGRGDETSYLGTRVRIEFDEERASNADISQVF